MKKYLSVLSFIGVLFITGCSDDGDINLYASIAEHEESKAIITSLSIEINVMKERLIEQNEKITQALDLLKNQNQLFADVKGNSSFIQMIGKVDFDSVDELKSRVGSLEAKIEAAQVQRAKKRLAKVDSIKKEKRKLNVFVSKINNWGGSLVAIINIPGKGFDTFSVYSSVGNDWSISKIDTESVSFVHSSGNTSRVFL